MENGISLAPHFQRFSSKLHNTDYLHGRQEREREREKGRQITKAITSSDKENEQGNRDYYA